MITSILESFVRDILKQNNTKDNMISFLVKKKKRGTYQALQECADLEIIIFKNVVEYLQEYLKHKLMEEGPLNKEILKEIYSQIDIELSTREFSNIKKQQRPK